MGIASARRAEREIYSAHLSCRHKKSGVARRGETRPIAASRKLKTKRQRSKPWTPACAGRRIAECRAPKRICRTLGDDALGTVPAIGGNGEAEPAAAFPFCSAERQPAAGGNCRVDV
ncbi:MAG: hypothetical protein H6950_01985 [Zoogloeaceae bacterium]|nr:hypothetical protein [Zoogloeaceae bacterium]